MWGVFYDLLFDRPHRRLRLGWPSWLNEALPATLVERFPIWGRKNRSQTPKYEWTFSSQQLLFCQARVGKFNLLTVYAWKPCVVWISENLQFQKTWWSALQALSMPRKAFGQFRCSVKLWNLSISLQRILLVIHMPSDMTRCCPDHLEGALHLVQNPAPFQLEEVPWSRNSVMVNWLGFWQLYPLNKICTVCRVYTFVVANVALLCSFYFPDSRQERTAFTHFPEQRLQEQSIAWTVPVRVAICLLIPRGACGRRKPT